MHQSKGVAILRMRTSNVLTIFSSYKAKQNQTQKQELQ